MNIFGQTVFSLKRVRGLFRRYRQKHYRSSFGGFNVFSPSGAVVLEITEIAETLSSTGIKAVRNPAVTFRLSAEADASALRGRMQPANVLKSPPAKAVRNAGFRQDHTTGIVPVFLDISPDGEPAFSVPVPRVPVWRRQMAGAAIVFSFGRAVAASVPAGLRWMRRKSAADKQLVKEILGLAPLNSVLPLNDRLFSPHPKTTRTSIQSDNDAEVLVILPVYNAFAVLQEAIHRLKEHTTCPWRLVVIEDCSTDPGVRPWLRDLAEGSPRITLIENNENLGFVGSVNRGFAEVKSHSGPVLLLNSDALLPPDWNARMLRPFADPLIASVTPLSNDAEIMNVPVNCVRRDLKPGEADRLDAVLRDKFASDVNGVDPAAAELPTGVGFCMALSADWLRKAGGFDPEFGPGYGEEVDWCQRVRTLGGKHIGIGNLFVEHRGGECFRSAKKQRLTVENSARISDRYPHYDQDVQDFIAADPLISARLQAGLALAAIRSATHPDPDLRALQVWIGHSLGGGCRSMVIRPDQPLCRGWSGCSCTQNRRGRRPVADRTALRRRGHSRPDQQ